MFCMIELYCLSKDITLPNQIFLVNLCKIAAVWAQICSCGGYLVQWRIEVAVRD